MTTCSKCKNPKRDPNQEHPGICICGGYLDDFPSFEISLDEARALNQLLRIHHGLFRDQPQYIHLLRLINGLGTFVDFHDQSSNKT